MQPLLPELAGRPWNPDGVVPGGLKPVEFYLHPTDALITVRVAEWAGATAPKAADLEKLWTALARKLHVVVLVVVRRQGGREIADIVGGRAKDRGTGGFPKPLIRRAHEIADVRAFCRGVLGEPDQTAAGTFVGRWLDERATDLPGLKNDGLFARHTLRTRVPNRSDWPDALDHAKRVRELAGRPLVEGLGFTIRPTEEPRATVLVGEGGQRAVALFLEEHEGFDDPADSLARRTPVTHALAVARRLNVPWIVLTRGRAIRLHPVSPDRGVGRRGRSTTYAEIDLRLLPKDQSGYLWLLFSSAALAEDGSAEQILADSSRYAADLGGRLRERIFGDVIPDLAELVGERMRELGETDVMDDRWLDEAYRNTMVILFRTLFVAYAEDRGLLPYERNERYTEHSLKQIAQDLDRHVESGVAFDQHDHTLWNSLVWTWTTVAKGNREVGVPPYGGGLFEESPFLDLTLLTRPFSNAEIGPALTALLLDTDDDGELGPVDFRSLSVREFGTIYEGLLESELSVATEDLTLDRDGNYVPITAAAPDRPQPPGEPAGDAPPQPIFHQGRIYFHNRSGARKSSGTYFTKPFVVEYLLDRALEPAIDDHLARVKSSLDSGDQAAAAARFFDFRVADIAMGSGHFLVAAIDRVEARFGDFLAVHDLPSVRRELDALRKAASSSLDGSDDAALIEDASLLRRQIARRCIYGVDLNRVAVELARLAIWIHTFVPGLPMSYLDHTLVVGNSLTGIGTLEEADAVLETRTGRGGTATFASAGVIAELEKARPALARLQTVADTTVADVRAAEKADAEGRKALHPLADLLDLLVLQRAGLGEVALVNTDPAEVRRVRSSEAVVRMLQALAPLHFPIAFPEVFLRNRPGFDCILGNPPWQELTLEEPDFWAREVPGLKALNAGQRQAEMLQLQTDRPEKHAAMLAEQEQLEDIRAVLLSGPYEGMSTGDPDLYKAFAWRFWTLLSGEARAGVVLPRSILTSAGSAPWRKALAAVGGFESVTTLKNIGRWVFDDVGDQYAFGLVTLQTGRTGADSVVLAGPHRDQRGLSSREAPMGIANASILDWTDTAAFPALAEADTLGTFLKMRAHAPFGSRGRDWWAAPVRELDATNDRGQMVLAPAAGAAVWPVYKGASFNLWTPDTGRYYASADPTHITSFLFDRRTRQSRNTRSAFHHLEADVVADRGTLPCLHARIAFRDIARATDPRTLIVSLVPPDVVLTNKAPYLLFVEGDVPAQAFVLGLLASRVVDWVARLFVELSVNFHILLGLPIPSAGPTDETRGRLALIAGDLGSRDPRFEDWRHVLGLPAVATAPPLNQADVEAEVDALVAHLYGLDEGDLTRIMETFHSGWDHRRHLARCLDYFRNWQPR